MVALRSVRYNFFDFSQVDVCDGNGSVVESPHRTAFFARKTDGIDDNTSWQEAARFWQVLRHLDFRFHRLALLGTTVG
jgi:hypothetical protein